jgi:hypothetical protein
MTRHAHQVTACAIHALMDKAPKNCVAPLDLDADIPEFDSWRTLREAESPQFQYWSITLRLELDILMFVRSLREEHFQLYTDSIAKIIPWFFALDHPNYARWMSVHIRDMMSRHNLQPHIAAEFEMGNFVVHNAHHAYSSTPLTRPTSKPISVLITMSK